ncbi:hypothetical protein DBR40_07405 [Pedobacter sp. KBW01]|nr:hypothetical protein DBR40_07405 [Pedobacter sp. KBW01]
MGSDLVREIFAVSLYKSENASWEIFRQMSENEKGCYLKIGIIGKDSEKRTVQLSTTRPTCSIVLWLNTTVANG